MTHYTSRLGARAAILIISLLWSCQAGYAAQTTVARVGDAFVSRDVDAAVWQVGAGGTALSLRLGPGFDFATIGLLTANARQWISQPLPDTTVTINDTKTQLGSSLDGWTYETAVGSRQGAASVRLDASFISKDTGVRAVRHYQTTAGTPTFEVWTTFQSLTGATLQVSNLNAIRLTVPNGAVRWLTGLNGDNATVERDSAFATQARALAAGASMSIGSSRRCSETQMPWFIVDGSPDEFFASLLWSGAWSLNIARADDALTIDFGLGSMKTTAGAQGLDSPHAIFGVTRGGLPQATAAIRTYGIQGIRGGRALSPLVTYNTWFAYGVRIDETTLKAEMDRVAALGTELFVVDAGWYANTGRSGDYDFDAGLGNWQVDPARFPNGLKALTDYAHGLGMKFGLWVEPERVNLETVGTAGLADETWLAKTGTSYGTKTTALICFGNAAGRRWVQQKLFDLLDQAQPDYLKWDNNLWINCDRAGHDHGPTDGNFTQINGLYDMLSAVRARYASMAMENVASGGNRLDLGMLRYTDAAWMDDRTSPSVRVRHNVQGLAEIFPPAYLLSFVTNHSTEPLPNAADLPLLFRSRMAGVLGLCFRSDQLASADVAAVQRQIETYKNIRATQSGAYMALLSAQARSTNPPAWEAFQETGSSGDALVFLFQNDPKVRRFTVKPTGLASTTTYEVRSLDGGLLATLRGSVLASTGVDVPAATTAAQVLVITPK